MLNKSTKSFIALRKSIELYHCLYNHLPVYRKNVEVFYEHKHAIVDRIFREKSFFPRFPFPRSIPYTHHLESLLLHTAQAIGLVMNRILSKMKVWCEYFYDKKDIQAVVVNRFFKMQQLPND